MTQQVLVAYATRAGSTATVAERIAQILTDRGLTTNVQRVTAKSKVDLAPYYAVVLGTAIRVGKPMPEIVSFAKQHRADLAEMRVAYFLVCGTLREDTPSNRAIVEAYLEPLRTICQPVSEADFAGAMDLHGLNPLLCWWLRRIGVQEGDWRDWPAIEAWAAQLADGLRETPTMEQAA